MKNKLTKARWLLPILFALISSCSDSDKSEHNTGQDIIIKSITPEKGGMAEDMMIYGENFTTNKANIAVTINGKEAAVIGSTMDRIFIIIPRRLEPVGVVQVTIGDKKSNEMPFEYRTSEVVETLAGNGTSGDSDGAREDAQFNFVDMSGLAISPNGNIYVADPGNNKIRSITPEGVVKTVASGLAKPYDVTFDPEGNLYFANCNGFQIGKIDTKGVVSYIGQMTYPTTVAFDEKTGKVYATLFEGSEIKVIKDMEEEAGGAIGDNMEDFNLEGSYKIAFMNFNKGDLYFTTFDHAIYKVPAGTKKAQLVAGKPGIKGIVTEPTNALEAALTNPSGITFSENGDIYFASGLHRSSKSDDNRIFIIRASDNKVAPFIGLKTGGYSDGQGSQAKFDSPNGLAVDAEGTIYVLDKNNHSVRKITVQ